MTEETEAQLGKGPTLQGLDIEPLWELGLIQTLSGGGGLLPSIPAAGSRSAGPGYDNEGLDRPRREVRVKGELGTQYTPVCSVGELSSFSEQKESARTL